MQVNLNVQKDGVNTLAECIKDSTERNPKKIYFFCGILKESGFNILEENIIDLKSQMIFAIGIDKKNTNKNMLESLIKYSKEVYVYNNNQVNELDSNIIVFEYSKEATLVVSSSNLSEGGIKDNFSYYSIIKFDLNEKSDKDEYKKYIKGLTSGIESESFTKLDRGYIEKLVDDKEIFTTKQYNHNVKSISELLGKSKTEKIDSTSKTSKNDYTKEDAVEIYNDEGIIPKIDLSGINVDIEIPEVEIHETIKEEKTKNKLKKEKIKIEDSEILYDKSTLKEDAIFNDESGDYVDKENELYDENFESMDFDPNGTLDIENMLFSKADVKLDVTKKPSKTSEKKDKSDFDNEEKIKVKKVDLDNVSNLIIELEEKPLKGQESLNIKIPNLVKETIPNFFELTEKGRTVEKDGQIYKIRNIKIEVVDVKNNQKYTDREAKLMHKKGQTFITFTSDILKYINFLEKDIARIIKLSSDIYHIEVIAKDMQEYKLWNKLCTQSLKSTTRKFGVM